MKYLVIFLVLFGGSSISFGVKKGPAASSSRASSKAKQDSKSAQVHWRIQDDRLEWNPVGAQWENRFDKNLFKKLTQKDSADKFHLNRFEVVSNKAGSILLLVDNGQDGDGQKVQYLFSTRDYGMNWTFKDVKVKKPSPPPAPPEPAPPASQAGQPVDLNRLEDKASASAKGSDHANFHSPNFGVAPLFKIYFDLSFYYRPGIPSTGALSFDNYHALLLVDFIPRPELQFSFEVNPAPRYYELDYKPYPRLTFRAGKIWIPFDDMGPHNYFGGHISVSRLQPPGTTTAFLPDIWTDLGVGIKYAILDTKKIELIGDVYVVNGFQDGAVDPLGQLGTKYPNFSSISSPDNNNDKALGARLHLMVDNFLGVGGSIYRGRYSQEGDPFAGIIMLGIDSQLKLRTGTEFRIGYVTMNGDLIAPANPSTFLRSGFYLEGSQRIKERWKLILRGGSAQNDNRIVAITDQVLVGGLIVYDMQYLQVSLQYFRDLAQIVGKTNFDYGALRLVVML